MRASFLDANSGTLNETSLGGAMRCHLTATLRLLLPRMGQSSLNESVSNKLILNET